VTAVVIILAVIALFLAVIAYLLGRLWIIGNELSKDSYERNQWAIKVQNLFLDAIETHAASLRTDASAFTSRIIDAIGHLKDEVTLENMRTISTINDLHDTMRSNQPALMQMQMPEPEPLKPEDRPVTWGALRELGARRRAEQQAAEAAAKSRAEFEKSRTPEVPPHVISPIDPTEPEAFFDHDRPGRTTAMDDTFRRIRESMKENE
jgi:hypothetical protein